MFHRFTQQAKHVKHPKTGECFSPKFCGAPTFPDNKKKRHVTVGSTWQSLTPIRPPDAWKLLKSLQGTPFLTSVENMELVGGWWAIGKCWWETHHLVEDYCHSWWVFWSGLDSGDIGSMMIFCSGRVLIIQMTCHKELCLGRLRGVIECRITVCQIYCIVYKVILWFYYLYCLGPEGYTTVYDPLPFCHRKKKDLCHQQKPAQPT